MNKDKRLMVIVFGILSLLSINTYLIINERSVFGLTLGALIISLSTCFDFPEDLNKDKIEKAKNEKWSILNANKYKIIQEVLYSIGFVVMFIILFIKPDTIVDEFMQKINSNTLMLMSICITFLSITISDINTKAQRNNIRKYYLDLFEGKVLEIEKRLNNKRGESENDK